MLTLGSPLLGADQLVGHDVGHRVFRFTFDRVSADFLIALRSALINLLAGACQPSATGALRILAALGLSACVYRFAILLAALLRLRPASKDRVSRQLAAFFGRQLRHAGGTALLAPATAK